MTSLAQRFWSKVDVSSDSAACWLWRGAILRKYGRFNFEGQSRTAHRVAYILTNGPIRDGLLVCHTCDNPPCVNPAHLWLGTNADNMRDMAVKGRSGCAPKLNAENVFAILSDPRPGPAVAADFGVSNVTIHKIRTRQTWKHLRIEEAA